MDEILLRRGKKNKGSLKQTPSHKGTSKSILLVLLQMPVSQGHLFDFPLFHGPWSISNKGTDGKLIVQSLQITKRQSIWGSLWTFHGEAMVLLQWVRTSWEPHADPLEFRTGEGCAAYIKDFHTLYLASSVLTGRGTILFWPLPWSLSFLLLCMGNHFLVTEMFPGGVSRKRMSR